MALGALSWWGAFAWDSAFMFAFGCVWWGVAFAFCGWVIYVYRE